MIFIVIKAESAVLKASKGVAYVVHIWPDLANLVTVKKAEYAT